MAIEEESISLNTPQMGGKDGYLQLFFLSRQQFGRIIEEAGGPSDKRLLMFTRFMISSVVNDVIRASLEDEISEIEKEVALLGTNEERAEALFVELMRIQGDVSAYFDQFLGISHRLRVGTV
jgi:hypothetical protein